MEQVTRKLRSETGVVSWTGREGFMEEVRLTWT